MYEASVAGTIPIIRVIDESLMANRIYKISGIINGTTNYILSRMTNEHMEFDEALSQAQSLGYAEADPSSDIEGYDAMYKIAILSRLSYGKEIQLNQIERTELTSITLEDIEKARDRHCVVKYIAQSECRDGQVRIQTGLQEIPMTNPLAAVENTTNAVYLYCDKAGEVLLQGQGAGAEPTASAVIADILCIIEKHF